MLFYQVHDDVRDPVDSMDEFFSSKYTCFFIFLCSYFLIFTFSYLFDWTEMGRTPSTRWHASRNVRGSNIASTTLWLGYRWGEWWSFFLSVVLIFLVIVVHLCLQKWFLFMNWLCHWFVYSVYSLIIDDNRNRLIPF